MAGVTDIERAQLARAAGFPENQIAMATAISIAENRSGDPAATHTNADLSIDTGLWQINSIHGIPVSQLKDPATNAKAAFKIWSDAGGSWHPWTTYNTGAWKLFFQRGQFAAKDKSAPTGTGVQVSVADGSSLQSVADFFKFISDVNNWRRIGMFVAGMVLIIIALFKMTGNNQLSSTTKSVVKLAAAGAAA